MAEIIFKGWSHTGCGPWTMAGVIPIGWYKVKGKTKEGDKCLVATAAGIKISKRRRKKDEIGDRVILSKWAPIMSENIGKEARYFFGIIRKRL
jgi:hypothetical protein